MRSKEYSKIIKISAHDRQRIQDSSADFTIDIPAFAQEFRTVTAIAPLSIQIPHVFTNINQYNNVLILNDLVLDQTYVPIVVPVGQYNETQLFSTLQTLIDTTLNAPGTSITISEITSKITITFPTGAQIGTDPSFEVHSCTRCARV